MFAVVLAAPLCHSGDLGNPQGPAPAASPSTISPATSPAAGGPSPTLPVSGIQARQGEPIPPSTTEIPQAVPGTPSGTLPSPTASADNDNNPPAGQADYDDGVIRYQHANDSNMTGRPIRSLQEFMAEGDLTSPLGIEVREDKRKVRGGEEAQGLLIIEVIAGSPAARAGLRGFKRAPRDFLETVAVVGAVFFPPSILLVPVLDQVTVGETYDLIIAVDGSRVTNFVDFEDRLRDLQAGEIVYLTIVRNGERMQVPVRVPTTLAGPTF